MKFQLSLKIPPLPQPIRYTDKLLLIGSCFTEHITARLTQHKFKTLQNPNGILFNPLSVAKSLEDYASDKSPSEGELFYVNELWNSWDYHSCFSHIHKASALESMKQSQQEASAFIKDADWIVLTLGSAFHYALRKEGRRQSGRENAESFVANNHRAPASWFEKTMSSISEIEGALSRAMAVVAQVNPKAKFLFTISPVRHVRDGLMENSRSKARLIEAVHSLCDSDKNCFYFPAYEMLIDVLRDYRYYDIDLVHPNYAATSEVWDAFVSSCIDPEIVPIMEQVKDIEIAKNHRPRFPETEAHQGFLRIYAEKVKRLMEQFPFLDLQEELKYFLGE
ncbi:MAG: GSCFA domain-containing protein [Chitinophagaceae bacterium]